MKTGEEFTEGLEQLLASRGEVVQMDSPECCNWKKEHSNCKGCSDELPCSKLVGLMAASFDANPARHLDEILESTDAEAIRMRDYHFQEYYEEEWE